MPTLKNPKHERFAQGLASGKSAAESYEAAGYKPSRHNASHLHRNDTISQRVAELLAEREQIHGQATAKAIEATGLTKEWVLERLVENANRSMQAEAAKDEEGNITGEYRYNGTVANRALELLGKELGMFIDRKEVGKPGEFTDMDDDALLKQVRERAKMLGVPLPKTLN